MVRRGHVAERFADRVTAEVLDELIDRPDPRPVGRARRMGGDDHVRERPEWAVGRQGFGGEHVEPGAAEVLVGLEEVPRRVPTDRSQPRGSDVGGRRHGRGRSAGNRADGGTRAHARVVDRLRQAARGPPRAARGRQGQALHDLGVGQESQAGLQLAPLAGGRAPREAQDPSYGTEDLAALETDMNRLAGEKEVADFEVEAVMAAITEAQSAVKAIESRMKAATIDLELCARSSTSWLPRTCLRKRLTSSATSPFLTREKN